MKTLILIFAIVFSSCATTKQYNPKERYCIVVESVRYGKKSSSIQPKCQDPKYKKSMPWYRYPSINIHPGDTVDVCDYDIKAPRF
jgi:hypothetical protein